MAKEKTAVKCVSPKGELAWVTIDGEGKENMSGKMQYVATVILDPKNVEEHQAFLDKIDEYWEEKKPEGRKKPKSTGYSLYDPLLDDDGEKQYKEDDEGNKKLIMDPDGRVGVQFKTGVKFPDGKTKKVKIFNSKNVEVGLGDQKIGNGSVGRISGAMGIYVNKEPGSGKVTGAGVTLYLDAIQLVKFEAYEGGDAGFEADDEDEDGFTGVDEDSGFGDAPDAVPNL